MNLGTLELGNRINSEIKTLTTVQDYFERHNGTAATDVLSDFF